MRPSEADLSASASVGERRRKAATWWPRSAARRRSPTRWEGAPLVIPECQQLGAIPLATRVGAVAELIDDGVDGFLIDDVNDAAVVYGLRRAIMQLVEDDDLRRRMAGAAMARAQGNHWSTNFREIVAWLTAAA